MAHYRAVFNKKYNRVRFLCQIGLMAIAYDEAGELLDISMTEGETALAQDIVDIIALHCDERQIPYGSSDN